MEGTLEPTSHTQRSTAQHEHRTRPSAIVISASTRTPTTTLTMSYKELIQTTDDKPLFQTAPLYPFYENNEFFEVK